MQIDCCFTSVILVGWCDHKTALTGCQKNAQKKNTSSHMATPFGRLVHKGYSLRYVAAHNCTTSGFRVTFKFWGLLGSTSYKGAHSLNTGGMLQRKY